MKKLVKTAALVLSALFLLSSCEQAAVTTGTDADTTSGDMTAEQTADVTTGAVTGTDTETEPEEETTEAPLPPPYDDAHAYIFADNNKETKWVTYGVSASREFNVLKLIPTNHDPMIYCSFTENERFDSQEYPYVAYRYNVKSSVNQGVFFVCSENHTSFSDSGLTWVDVKNNGEWTNNITDMRDNAFWEGTITAFRIDPINSGWHDKKAVILLDRVGFFKTKEDAQVFLDDAKEPDYSESLTITEGFAKAIIPGGTLSAGYDTGDYLLKQETAAEIKNGIAPLVAYETDGKQVILPASYVNSVGFVSYLAPDAGKYSLVYPEKEVKTDGDFVLVRGLMSEAELKADKVAKETAARVLYSVSPAEIPADTDKSGDADAKFASNIIGQLIGKYKIAVCTDKTLAAKGLSKEEKTAVCSGVTDDIDKKSYTGEEFASLAVRLIKALLGQPVFSSNVSDGDGITIGAWSNFNFDVTEETIKTFSDAGLSLLIDLGSIEQRDVLATVLNSADKYGVKVLRHNYYPDKFNKSKPTEIPAESFEYYDYKSYYGNIIFDEPGTDSFDMMADITDYYNEKLPGKLCYYNLLPMYANAAQLKYGANAAKIDYYDPDPDLYEKYVSAYAEKIPGGYICVDIYPYRSNGSGKKNYSEYLRNMAIFADVCRRYDRDFWLFIQSTDYDGGKWAPDYYDLIWQMNIGVSFGVKTFLHYLYNYNNHHALVDEGKTTEIYDAAKKADLEILAFSDEYAKYKNVGAFNMNCSKARYAYAQFDNQYDGFTVLKDIDSGDPLLFGCFEEKDGDGYAFTVVNMYDLSKKNNANVSFKVDGDRTLTAWIHGEKVELKPENGVYTLSLEPAEGVFIEVK